MQNKLVNFFQNKKILILGFGREGQAAFKFLSDNFMPDEINLSIADKSKIEITDEKWKDNTKLICGEKYLDNLNDFDIIMKSPGVSLKDVDISSFQDKIYSELELFLAFFNGMTIGVTGTKGKSTTSTLIYQIIKDQDKDTVLVGNIGVPIFARLNEISSDTIVVLEMSSHQLQFIRHSPRIAILTNVFPEHLDYYKSFDDYKSAKENIFRFQEPNDVALRGDGVQPKNVQTKLLGEFNQTNIALALNVSEILGLDLNRALETVRSFSGLKHRLEFVAEVNGVKYYDNAIATIPEATIAAIKAIPDVETVIIGGMDRKVDQSKLIEFLKNSEVKNVICLPDTGFMIADNLDERAKKVHTMKEAVDLAKKLTSRGKSCLLSPAAASYNAYKNFEEKGDEFQKLVREE